MYEERCTTDDFYDPNGCVTGGSSHVGLTVDEQCGHQWPLGHTTLEIEPHITVLWDRKPIVSPKMHYAARPAECSSTVK